MLSQSWIAGLQVSCWLPRRTTAHACDNCAEVNRSTAECWFPAALELKPSRSDPDAVLLVLLGVEAAERWTITGRSMWTSLQIHLRRSYGCASTYARLLMALLRDLIAFDLGESQQGLCS